MTSTPTGSCQTSDEPLSRGRRLSFRTPGFYSANQNRSAFQEIQGNTQYWSPGETLPSSRPADPRSSFPSQKDLLGDDEADQTTFMTLQSMMQGIHE